MPRLLNFAAMFTLMAACDVLAGLQYPTSIPSAVIRRGVPGPSGVPGETVDFIRGVQFNTAHGFGFLYSVGAGSNFTSEVFGCQTGEPAHVLQRGFMSGVWVQNHFSVFDLDDTGNISTTGFSRNLQTGAGSLWQAWNQGVILATQNEPVTAVPGRYFGAILDIDVTTDGRTTFVADLLDAPDGNRVGSILLSNNGSNVLLKTGDAVSGLSGPVSRIDNFFAISPSGNHWITRVQAQSSEEWALVIDGAVAQADGGAIIENAPIPSKLGAIGERWGWFFSCDINDAGDWIAVGNSQTGKGEQADSFGLILKNGVIQLQQGVDVPVGKSVYIASLGDWSVRLNATGDWTTTIGLENNLGDFLYAVMVNGIVVLKTGDSVDLNGDGQPNEGALVSSIDSNTEHDGVGIENRDAMGSCRVALLVQARIGTSPPIYQGGFLMNVQVAPPPPTCAADANGDLIINAGDLSVLLSQFGHNVTPGSGADFNDDGVVNGSDLSILLAQFGDAC